MNIQEIRQNYPQYDDMSDQQLADALHSKFYSDMDKNEFYGKVGLKAGQPQDGATGSWEPPTQEQIDAASKSSRFLHGMKDPVNGLAQLMLHALPDKGILKGSSQYIDNQLAADEAQYQDARKATGNDGIDWMRMGGNMVSTAPVMAIAPGGGATLAGRAVAGAATGSGLGALNPVTNGGDYWDEKGQQAITGAKVGGVTGAGSELLARVISPRVSQEAQLLINNGVTPTPGQLLGGFYKTAEDKATSVPILGDAINSGRQRAMQDFNRAVYNDVLSPLGQKAGKEVGNEGVDAVQQAVGKSYDDALTGLSYAPDEKFASQITDIVRNSRPEIGEKVNDTVKSVLSSRVDENGVMTEQAIKDAESELSNIAHNYTRSSMASEREFGQKIKQILSGFRESLQRSSSDPEQAALLQKTNDAYSRLKVLENAAARDINGGVFTPGQMQYAVRNASGKSAFAGGNGRIQELSGAAQKVLGNTYPDSGTAGRTLLAALFGGGMGYVSPTALGATLAASGAYTPMGQKAMMYALTKRPEVAKSIANGLRMLPSPVGNNFGYSLLNGR